jgi:hypothetical protein
MCNAESSSRSVEGLWPQITKSDRNLNRGHEWGFAKKEQITLFGQKRCGLGPPEKKKSTTYTVSSARWTMIAPKLNQRAPSNLGENVRRSALVAISVALTVLVTVGVPRYLQQTEVELLEAQSSARDPRLVRARIQALASDATESKSGGGKDLATKIQTMWVSSEQKIGELEGEAAIEHSDLARIKSKVGKPSTSSQ